MPLLEMHLGFVSHTYKNCHFFAPKFPGKGLAVLTILPQLLGCEGEKSPMSYRTKSHQSTPKPPNMGMVIPSPAVPQQFGQHKPTPGNDLQGEAADIHLEPPSQPMPLPSAATSVIIIKESHGHRGEKPGVPGAVPSL